MWHSAGSNFSAIAQATILCNEIENYTFNIIALSPMNKIANKPDDLHVNDDALINSTKYFPYVSKLLQLHYVKSLFLVSPTLNLLLLLTIIHGDLS